MMERRGLKLHAHNSGILTMPANVPLSAAGADGKYFTKPQAVHIADAVYKMFSELGMNRGIWSVQ